MATNVANSADNLLQTKLGCQEVGASYIAIQNSSCVSVKYNHTFTVLYLAKIDF